jgi:hypothetical protein
MLSATSPNAVSEGLAELENPARSPFVDRTTAEEEELDASSPIEAKNMNNIIKHKQKQ